MARTKVEPPNDDLDSEVCNGLSPKLRSLRLLSLDGGGVRGLSSLLMLKRLMSMIDPDNPPRPCQVFHLIGGTSTGGIIAIMLGRLEMDVDECIEAYLELSGRVFQPSWWRWPLDWRLRLHSRFSSEALEKSIKDIVYACTGDEDSLLMVEDDPECKIFVCSKRVNDNTTARLQNYASTHLENVKVWEAARATSAAPGFFDAIRIGPYSDVLMDGGIGCNNPIREVWHSAIEIWHKDETPFKDMIGCIVSIGTGMKEDLPFGPNLFGIAKLLQQMATETENTSALFERENEDLLQLGKYARFNVPQGLREIRLYEYTKTTEISRLTRKYLEKRDVQKNLKNCSEALLQSMHLDGTPGLPKLRTQGTHKCRRSEIRKTPDQLRPWLIFLLGFLLILNVAQRLWYRARSPSEGYINPVAPIIAIMGRTGVGKSTFINTLGGMSLDGNTAPIIGHGLESCTDRLIWYETTISGENVYLIDTPGFDDSRMEDSEIMFKIKHELVETFNGTKLLKGVIYLHDISSARIGGAAKKNIEDFEHLVGKFNFPNVVLVTTRWIRTASREEQMREESRAKELRENYWLQMLNEGSAMTRHDGTFQSAQLIVRNLIEKPTFVTLRSSAAHQSKSTAAEMPLLEPKPSIQFNTLKERVRTRLQYAAIAAIFAPWVHFWLMNLWKPPTTPRPPTSLGELFYILTIFWFLFFLFFGFLIAIAEFLL